MPLIVYPVVALTGVWVGFSLSDGAKNLLWFAALLVAILAMLKFF
ncbi:hypothetical protein QWY97_10510 [Vibrio cortegadensis]|nr:hypothetical protein [Vibrio cortegadensis]MDN3697777.1 hypothetical protein [Vibrio cortegadensis]